MTQKVVVVRGIMCLQQSFIVSLAMMWIVLLLLTFAVAQVVAIIGTNK